MSELLFATSDDVEMMLEARRNKLPELVNEAAAREGATVRSVVAEVMKRSRGCANPGDVDALARAAMNVEVVPRRLLPVEIVISGGQTGADRAALDAAREVGLRTAGWCPKGRIAEDGVISDDYGLSETTTANPLQRTALNVKHSMATLILSFDDPSKLSGVTLRTLEFCQRKSTLRPCLPVQLHPELRASDKMVAFVFGWLRKRKVQVLNVAGPRESKAPGIYKAAHAFMLRVLGREIDE